MQSLDSDYGYDLLLLLFTCDEHGYLEPGLAFMQFKATESLWAVGTAYVYDIDVRDYNLWMLENMPVVLILFDARQSRAYWLAIQHYFRQDEARRPRRQDDTNKNSHANAREPRGNRADS